MLIAILLASSLAAGAADCQPPALQASLRAAIGNLQRKDMTAVKAALAPVLSCPADTRPAYMAHVLRAEVAANEGDWTTARSMLADAPVRADTDLSARAAAILLKADQGLGDRAAFAADRSAVLAANDAGLKAGGRKIESFRAGAAQVDAYETPVEQGGFHRVMEFIVTPEDASAFPLSILLTDDRSALAFGAELAKSGEPKPKHVWFIDLYTCSGHSNLKPVANLFGAEPAYAEVKAIVIATLGDARAFGDRPTGNGGCYTASWLLPGLGATAAR